MTDGFGSSVDLLAVRCDALGGPAGGPPSETLLADVCAEFDPDLVYVVRDGRDARVVGRLRRTFHGPIVDPAGPASVRTETIGGVTIAVASRLADLEDAIGSGAAGAEDAVDAAYVVCDGIDATADEVALEATLDGAETIARYRSRSRSRAESPAETTFLTGSLPASYDHVWRASVDGREVRLPIRGLGPIPRSGAPELARLTLASNGAVSVSSVPADRFGLRALEGVGPTTARRLREVGYDSRERVAGASLAALRSVQGIGDETAWTIRASARSLAEGLVIRRSAEPVPPVRSDPIFVDIETDGLAPTIVWLIGVYDSQRGTYVDFIDTDPSRDDPGAATRSFVEWLAAEYDRPALVTWNGHGFDYKHLDRFVSRYAPGYRDYWREDVLKYDCYDWAVRRDNAVLPGRTNRLEDVAEAIGGRRDGAAATLDGKTLAGAVRRTIESDRPAGIDWEAARAYCEADVRELAAVYDAIEAADIERATPVSGSGRGSERESEGGTAETTQTGLGDF
ncbi:ribonuclease H-like domain-containing protein [Halosolutus gelatinilyticus]|uniref:ribonuclease H-like domain-containing protein n=1 Tax=Halosolutus gelatinilyticus TaxID=2931975 RepID=UPI001FF13E29|nr:ribonuclease H-like domain-containing protein [Halosolutus gelatinilyticus]